MQGTRRIQFACLGSCLQQLQCCCCFCQSTLCGRWQADHALLRCALQVARVADGLPAVDALRQVIDRVRTDNFVLLRSVSSWHSA